MCKFMTFVLLALVLVTFSARADSEAFFKAFSAQLKNPVVGKRCTVERSGTSDDGKTLEIDLEIPGPTGVSALLGIPISFEITPENYFEKVNKWNWYTTDNLGNDMYRFIRVVQPRKTSVYEVYITVKQKDQRLVAISVRLHRGKDVARTKLTTPFSDIVSSTNYPDCILD